MASRNMVEEVMSWLSRQWRIDWTDRELYDDWGRMLDSLTDDEARKAKTVMEIEYRETYRPTPGLFRGYVPGRQWDYSSNMNFNPSKFWRDDDGLDWADLTETMIRPISNPSRVVEARERVQAQMRGYAGDFNTPLAIINRMLKKQGLQTHKSQADWDAKKAELKSMEEVC